jgi:casein kinase II subunit alpha
LAGVIFKKDPFFYGKELIEQLLVITDFAGTDALFNYTERHNLELPEELLGAVSYEPKKNLKMYLSRENEELVTPDALDFIALLREFDRSERILAGEALQHPYFDPVRELMHRVSIGSWDVPNDSLETAKVLESRRRLNLKRTAQPWLYSGSIGLSRAQ